jgi:uncharacterized protein (TIGR03118 family)
MKRSIFSVSKVAWLCKVCCVGWTLSCVFTSAQAQTTSSYQQTNLVSDGSVAAQHADPTLINPWGIAIGQATPFWVNSQGGGVSEIYDAAGNKQFDVGIPGNSGSTTAGHPTGIVFNASNTDFMLSDGLPATFVFATTDGTLAGWNANLVNAVTVVDNSASGAVYTGLALASTGSGNMLLAANFSKGAVDVFNNKFMAAKLNGTFSDPALPAGYAPYGIHVLNNQIVIDYALQRPGGGPPLTGAGNGVVDMFDMNGNYLKRVAAGGTLNAPWAAVLAPAGFGSFGGALLIGNFGDGAITAFDASTFAVKGQLQDGSAKVIANPGLWDLVFGQNGVGDPNTLYFSAGINDEKDGLFGTISLATAGTASGNFSLTTSVSSLSVPAGQSASLTVNVSPQMGFSAPVSLSCTGLPSGATCSFSPTSVTPTAGAVASSTLTVSTSPSTPIGTYGLLRRNNWAPAWPLFSGVTALVGVAWPTNTRKRRLALKFGVACLGLLLVIMLASCGSGSRMSSVSPQGGTSSGTGQMTITATSGAISQSTGVTLMVQ